MTQVTTLGRHGKPITTNGPAGRLGQSGLSRGSEASGHRETASAVLDSYYIDS